MKLSEEQKNFYREQGYLVIEGILSQDEVETVRRSLENLIAQHAAELTESTQRFLLSTFSSQKGKLVQQIADPHEMTPEFYELSRHPKILDVVEELLGSPNIQIYYSQLFTKPPKEGAQVPWHQDFAFFPHGRDAILGAMVLIDDATIENGCLRVVPGSHKRGLINHYKDGRFTGRAQVVEDFEDPTKHVSLPVKAGGMIFFNALTLHSSHANHSDRPRRQITFEFKDPENHLMRGSWYSRLEVRPVGRMVRGHDPNGELLAAY